MSTDGLPRLIDVQANVTHHNGQAVLFVSNRLRMSDGGLCVPMSLGCVLDLLDGRRSLEEVQKEALLRAGLRLEISVIEELVHALEGIYVLDGDRYRSRKKEMEREFLESSIREPVCAGAVYSADPGRLLGELDRLYTMPGGPGLPRRVDKPDGSLRMIYTPHIDYRRGRHSFAWGFKEIAERSDATTFVILATSHYSLRRYVLTRKSFRTPLGVARSNERFVDELESQLGRGPFEDEIAHKPEHSIELVTVLLQHALAGRVFSIVPILVGSFEDYVESRTSPDGCETTRRMIEAIRTAEARCGEKTCYVVSGDLAHIGPKFGDPWRIDSSRSQWCRAADQALLARIETASPADLFAAMASDQDQRRICGFPPLYVAMAAAQPSHGNVLCYDQFVDPSGFEIVSFASIAFEST